MKKTIFFDAAGTLFYVNGGVGVQYSRIAAKYGILQDPQLLEQRFYATFQKNAPLTFPGIPASHLKKAEKEWWRNLVSEVFDGRLFSRFDSFFEELYAFFGAVNVGDDDPPWICFPETLEVLEHLTSEGHPLGIISNFDSRLGPLLEFLGLTRFFQTVTISIQEGVEKPSVEIFKRAFAKAKCIPSHALFIGDNPDDDGFGALAAGIPFLLIDRSNDIPHSEQTPRLTTDLPTIKSLKEIYRYL